MAAAKPLLPVAGMTPESAAATSASIDPFAAFPEAQAALSTTTLMPPFSATPAGRGEAPAPAPAPEPVDAFAAFPEAPAPAPADSFSAFPEVTQTKGYDLDKLKATDAATLAKDKVEFNPVEFLARNEKALLADPAALQKVQDAYAEREKEKMTAGQFAKKVALAPLTVPRAILLHPIESAKTAKKIAESTGEFLGELAGGVGQVFKSAGQAAGAASAGDLKETSARLAEVVDAIDVSTQRWASLITQKVTPAPTDIRERMFRDSHFKKLEIEAAAGNGELARNLGTSSDELKAAGINLNPEAIQKLSVIEDPIFFVPIGGAVGVVSKGTKFLLGAAVGEARAAAFAKLANSMLERGAVGAAGRGVESAGSLSAKLNEMAARIPFLGTTTGTAKLTLKTAALASKGAEAVGRGIQAVAPAAGEVAREAVKGTAEAAFLSIPLFIGSTPEERDQLLGMVAAGGALRGGGAAVGVGAQAAGRAAQNKLASKIFEAVDRGPAVDSPYYGTDQKLDQAHAEYESKLTPGQKSVVNWTREFFRNAGIEVYTLDNKSFQNHVPQVGGAAAAEGFYTHRGERVSPDGATRQPVVQILLNGDTNGLGHELYHTFKSLDPRASEALESHINKTWTPEEQAWIADTYNAALNGGKPRGQWEVQLDKNQILEEAAAEVFGRVFEASDLSGVKPSVVDSATVFASSVLEKMGFPLAAKGLPKGPGVSALGIRPATSELKISRDFLGNLAQRVRNGETFAKPAQKPAIAGELVPGAISRRPVSGKAPTAPELAPTPAAPRPATAPAPVATPATPNIRVTPEEQLDYAAKRSQVTNADEAVKDAQKLADPKAVSNVEAINASMADGHGVEIVHKGVVREGGPTPEKPVGRGERRSEQEAAYVAEALGAVPDDIREQHQKVLFGTRWQKTGKSGQQLTARSLDKALANVKNAVEMADAAKVAVPYETAGGELTPAGWSEAVADLRDYWGNQDRGFRGDGEKLVRPTEDIGVSLPPEDPRGPVAKISSDRTDFLNLVQGLNIPEAVTRQLPGKIPGNVKGQLLAELQGKKPAKPAAIKPEDVTRQAYKPITGVSGIREIAEVNPLRNQLREAGAPVGKLIEVTENVNLKNIESVTPRPDVPGRGGSTDITRAGFSVSGDALKADVSRRLEEKKKAGIPITEIVRRKTQQEAEFAVRNPLRMKTGEAAGLFSVKPSEEIRDLAGKVAKDSGVSDYKPSTVLAPLNEGLGKKLADFYESAKSSPNDPAVKSSYDALIDQTEKQGKAILDAGYTIEPFAGEGEPYKNSAEMIADVRDNKHLSFLKTDAAFGRGAEAPSDNPMLRPSTTVPGQVANDVFRWVHDFFGHAKEGYQFGPRGEFNAWKSHSEMFTPEAQGALAAETLAQNSWVNFGKHLRNEAGEVIKKGEPGYVDAVNRPFGEQKNVVVPDELIKEAKKSAAEQASAFVEKGSVTEAVDDVTKMSVDQWRTSFTPDESLTKTAYRLGLKVKSADELAALQAGITKANADLAVALDKARAGNMDALDEMSTLATKGQFFREAYEAATDTKSAAGRFGWRKYFPEGKPAFAEATAPEGKFSPVTAAGKELIKEGYDFDIKGQLGARSAIVKKDGLVVGEITSSQKEPGTAFISLANVKKADRGHGVGEAAYRELLTQLKVDGVKEVTGMVVAPQPLAIREKIFGKGSTEIGDSERTVSVDDAMKELGDNALGFEVSNKITPESSFSAKRKSETEAQAKKRVEETDYSKYNVPVEHRPDTDTLTGWFTPDSKFVPIDTAYHQEWLAKNRAQLNKDFGTDFSSESSVEARLKATNAGFVRARDYGGTTHIELNQKFFKGATKAAIEDRVLNNADSIDKLQVTLLDDEGQVVDSTSAKLFDSEDPKAAAQAAIDSLKAVAAPVSGKGPSNIARMRALGGESFSVKKPSGESSLPGFAPEAATPHEKVVRAHVAGQKRAYPEALPVTHSRDESGNLKLGVGDKPITSKYDYELATSALAKKVAKGLKGQAREEAVTDAYAKGLEKLYADEAKNRPDIMDGVKWYSTARTCIKKLFGEDSKLFCELLGATSAQTPVDVNYRTAVDGYNLFKQGAYDKQIAQYRKGKATWDAGRIKEFIKATGNEKPNRSQFLDWWVEKYDLKPRKSNGTLFGANSRQVLRVLDGSWLEETQGPKTPNFAGNLAGTTFEATIDVWAARTLHRIGNEGLKDKWRILPESEQGVPDADFHLAQKAFRKAAAEIGIKPDALQAIVWFAEKDRWQRNGWTSTIGAEKSDFNVLLAESEKLPSGLIRKREPQLALSLNPGDIKSK